MAGIVNVGVRKIARTRFQIEPTLRLNSQFISEWKFLSPPPANEIFPVFVNQSTKCNPQYN